MGKRVMVWFAGYLCFTVGAAGAMRWTESVEPQKTLEGHKLAVTALAFFPDNTQLASGSLDKTIRVWDLKTGKTLVTFEGHEKAVTSVAVSPDGKTVASASEDATVRVWEVKSGDQIALLEGHLKVANAVAFLPDGKLLSGGGDGLRLWDVAKEKLLWKSMAGTTAELAISADGKRAAESNRSQRGILVWDLEAQKPLKRIAVERPDMTPVVGLNADGSLVYGTHNAPTRFWLARWEMESGRETRMLPASFSEGRQGAFARDGSLFLTDRGAVWDLETRKPWWQLQLPPSIHAESWAISPDKKSAAMGTGKTRDTFGGETLRNSIYVYSLERDAKSAPPPAPVEGKVSWEVIPAMVKTVRGEELPLDQCDWSVSFGGDVNCAALSNDLEVVWTGKIVALHEKKGFLREVLSLDDDSGITQVVWDGERMWVAAKNHGVLVLDREGKTIGSVILPTSDKALVLHVLGPGKVMAAGVAQPNGGASGGAKGTGWAGVLEWKGRSAEVNVFFREKDLGDEWKRRPNASHFVPMWMMTGPLREAGKEGVWIMCESIYETHNPILRVDPRTLSFEPYNMYTKDDPQFLYQVSPGRHGSAIRRDDRSFITCDFACRLHLVGEKRLEQSGERALYTMQGRPALDQMIHVGDNLLFPGPRWGRVNVKTFEAEDLGPGLPMQDPSKPPTIVYYRSNLLGAAGLNVIDGCFYSFSVDPQNPLANRGTGESRWKPVPAEGIVQPGPAGTYFIRGRGALKMPLTSGDSGTHIPLPYIQPNATLERDAELANAFVHKLKEAGEAERVGLQPAQLSRLQGMSRGYGISEWQRLNALFKEYELASDDAARAKAARPLLEAAQKFGEENGQRDEHFVERVKETLSPKQWKLALYQIPTAADSDVIPVKEEAPPVPVTVAQTTEQWRMYAGGGAIAMIVIGVTLRIRQKKKPAAASRQA